MVRLTCWYGIVLLLLVMVYLVKPPEIDAQHRKRLAGAIERVGLDLMDQAHSAASSNNIIEAVDLFKKAAANGTAEAAFQIARLSILEDTPGLKEGRKFAQSAAKSGHPEGTYLYATMLLTGLGGADDAHQAFGMYNRAAAANQVASQANLAWMHLNGFGTPADYQKGLLLAHHAATTGNNGSAQFLLALVHASGQGVDRDLPAAQHWASLAADNGHQEAKLLLALLTMGTQSNELSGEALAWLEDAAAKESISAIETLAWLNLHGVGMPQDVASAVQWYNRAALLGHSPSLLALGEIYEAGELNKAPNYSQAHAHYARAADRGSAEAMTRLGLLYSDGKGVSRDDREALRWFRQAERNGDAAAVTQIAIMHLKGRGVVKDEQRALECFQRAAEAADHDAEVYLGDAYMYGKLGLQIDHELAAEWFARAAEAGHPAAQSHLARMYQRGIGVPRDNSRGMELHRLAAQAERRERAFLPPVEEAYDLQQQFIRHFSWSPISSNRKLERLINRVPRIPLAFVESEPFSIAPTLAAVLRAAGQAQPGLPAPVAEQAAAPSNPQAPIQPTSTPDAPSSKAAEPPAAVKTPEPAMQNTTGWVCEDSLIVTAYNAIAGKKHIFAMILGSKRRLELVYSDPELNLALLKPTARIELPDAFWFSGAPMAPRDQLYILGASGDQIEILQVGVHSPRMPGQDHLCGLIGELPANFAGAPVVNDGGQVVAVVMGPKAGTFPGDVIEANLTQKFAFALRNVHVKLALREVESTERARRSIVVGNSADELLLQLRDSVVQILTE